MAPYPPWALIVTIALTRVLLVVGLLFGALPLLLFSTFPDRDSVGMVGRGVIFLFASLAVVHVLGFFKLYEGLLLLVLLAAALAWRFYFRLGQAERQRSLDRLGLWALAWIDRLTGRAARRHLASTLDLDEFTLPRPRVTWAEGAVFLGILGVATWMLFDGAYRHAAPAFSDAPVTLAWMKEFGKGIVYGNGVYPKGMYGFLTLIRKLTAQNDFLVMSVVGPLVGLGMVVGLAGFLRWTTGSTVAAAVGVLLYGTLPSLLPVEYARHVGYNSQEFGVLFALPAAWFAFEYLRGGNRWHGLAAAASAGITVFVHPVAAVICIALLGGAGVAALALKAFTWRRIGSLLALGVGAGGIGLFPPLVGLTLLRGSWHGSSEEFLTDSLQAILFVPKTEILVLVGLGLLCPVLLRRLRQPGVWLAWFVAGASLAVWVLPHAARSGALNTFAHRTGEAGGMGIAIAVGLLAAAVERYLPGPLGSPVGKAALLGAVAAGSWLFVPPQVPQPPRVSTDDEIIQALRVDREFARGDWMLVMDNMGYSLALENGSHLHPPDFIDAVRLAPGRACAVTEGGALTPLAHNIALFLDTTEPEDYQLLRAWVDQHKAKAPLSQVFASPTLEVWVLKYKPDPKAQFDAVWGTNTASMCTPGSGS